MQRVSDAPFPDERRFPESASEIGADSLRLLTDASPVGMYHAAPDGRILFANNRFCEITGLAPEQATGRYWRFIKVHEDDFGRVVDAAIATLAHGHEFFSQFRLLRPNGGVRWVHARATPIYSGEQSPAGIIGSIADVTEHMEERAEFEHALETRAAQRAVLVHLGQQALSGIEPVVLMHEAVAAVTSTLDVADCHVLEYVHETGRLRSRAGDGDAIDRFATRESALGPTIYAALEHETEVATTERAAAVVIGDPRRPFGVFCASGGPAAPFSSEDVHFLQTIANVLATAIGRSRVDAKLVHQALHDSLTGLPNRTRLLESLGEALARATRHPESVAVAFLDLDHFKVVNDGLGHDAGDSLLRAVANRLLAVLRPGDIVARFGGDEFVIVCEDIHGDLDAVEIAGRIQRTISRPLMLGEREVFPTASIGISRSRSADDTPETLVANADAAMYRAKERGRARHELFDENMRVESVARLETVNELRRALERDELRVHYQPVVDVETNTPTHAEALLRWQHPRRGEVLPREFIPDAEETGLIRSFGEWVLTEACAQALDWADLAPDCPVGVTVNLSARQLADPNLVATVRNSLASAGPLDPAQLSLEITESVLMEDAEGSLETLAALKRLGVSLLVDDFGTGYSSLSYLRRLPVDALKIDRSFVDGLGNEAEDSAIVAAVISMAHALSLDVIAEGVETQTQLNELRRLGCTMAQGHLFARPGPPDEITRILKEGTLDCDV